ncbi:hypothetical protein M8C21_019772 [Ambrosia artemisiifolia]|uniref:Leucine-rich repeat-containing N-terminal plant-type domain-containing protein n=1 Tax=Ambrosia artemisiifolia TaxID=4212 RepID=A0AAD5CYW9_AMBAR|nr:hypothetical protein M8C21_019772 [Ambrosia artemisiifolia]
MREREREGKPEGKEAKEKLAMAATLMQELCWPESRPCSIYQFFQLIDSPTNISPSNFISSIISPGLTGWTSTARDPCDEKWQGVVCDTTNTKIISITAHGANSGPELGHTLGAFSSLQSIDLSNNIIGGNIPADLPVTLTNM